MPKGKLVVERLLECLSENIHVSLIGLTKDDIHTSRKNTEFLGRYSHDELQNIIESCRINLVVFPSICPETFSYLISELIMMDVPIICFDFGAQAEKVGAPIAYKFLRNLKLDCATAHRIEGLVANHMKMHQLGMMDKKFSIMSVLNLPDFDLLCELCRSDSDGCIKTAVDDEEMPLDEALASPKIASLIGQPIPAPIVTGDDLIALGFKPSEKFCLESAFLIICERQR